MLLPKIQNSSHRSRFTGKLARDGYGLLLFLDIKSRVKCKKSKKSSSLWQIPFISAKEPFLAIFVPLEIYAPWQLNFKLKTIFYLQFVFVDTALPKVSRANFKFDQNFKFNEDMNKFEKGNMRNSSLQQATGAQLY